MLVGFFSFLQAGFSQLPDNALQPYSFDDILTDSLAFIYSASDSGGTVNYYRDKRLDKVFSIQKDINARNGGIPGYRVQLYRGNSQRLSKDRAFEIEAMVYQSFGNETDVNVIFNSPYWRVQVGNFRHQSDAIRMEADYKKAFPEIADDISVVPAMIDFPDLDKKNTYTDEQGQ